MSKQQDKTPRKRIPLLVEQAEYEALLAWARRNGFKELSPAIRWGLQQLGAFTQESADDQGRQ
jgi:hypothetical protein